MSLLNMVVDLGTSQTRVLWTVDDSPISFRCFTSDVSLPTSSQTADVMGSNSFLVECGGHTYVVGAQAAASPLSEGKRQAIKIEAAGPKVLSALHIALQRAQLSSPRISLSILLPFKECDSFSVLETALRKRMKEFLCNGVCYQLEVECLECLAEGSGLIRFFTHLYPSFEEQTILTVMVGHRDLSLIHSVGNNNSVEGRTARLGFTWMLNDIESQVGEIDRFKAASILYELGDSPIRSQHFRRLARTHAQDLRQAELSNMAKAARASRKTYKGFIKEIFKDLPMDIYDVVLLGGGAGDYLAKYIEKLIDNQVVQPIPLINQLREDYGFERSQAVRLADVYAVALMQQKSKQAVIA